MKQTGLFIVAFILATGCRERCQERLVRLYSGAQQTFRVQREVNNFALQLSYVPASLLMRPDKKGQPAAAYDTALYYFRLNVASRESYVPAGGNKTALFYGLDTLFAVSEAQPSALPVLVQPVNMGSSKHFEYLLVFAKKDFAGDQLKVVFFDRLFTNTKQVFVFDRKKIDELENLQCHPHEI